MSLESIINHILEEAKQQADQITFSAKGEADQLILAAKEEAEKLYQEILRKEESALEAGKAKLVVGARLESKKSLLLAKHQLIDLVFQRLESGLHKERFKKEQVGQEKIQEVSEDAHFYLDNIKLQYESEVAKILFS
jgi:vacuolar-type H+-ATPase subunit E/Vma4